MANKHGLKFTEPSRTKQNERDRCDIRNIIKRYKTTGKLPLSAHAQNGPMFGEFHNLPTYHEMSNIIIEARAKFMSLPSALRKDFDNDPGEMIAFLQNPENKEEAIRMGLMVPPPRKKPDVTDQLNDIKEALTPPKEPQKEPKK